MATVIDITGKIKNEEKFITYNGKSYKVDDSKNTMMKVYTLLDGDDKANIEMIDQVLNALLGPEAVKDFDGLAYTDYLVPFFAAMACVQNKSYDEVESSFRGQ